MLDIVVGIILGGALVYIYLMILQINKTLDLVAEKYYELAMIVSDLEEKVDDLKNSVEALYISKSIEEVEREEKTVKKRGRRRKKSGVEGELNNLSIDNTTTSDDSGKSNDSASVVSREGDKD